MDNETGNNNVALGMDAGAATDGSDNILIDNIGVAGESGIIRIGTDGIHTKTYLAGKIIGDGSGLTGITGPAGETGAAGADGPQGEQGLPGSDGAQGEAGPQGDPGVEGPAGADGTSVALLGSVADFASLPEGASQGDLWVTLDTGDGWVSDGAGGWTNVGQIQGPEGQQGEKGDPGDVGPKGEQGVSRTTRRYWSSRS